MRRGDAGTANEALLLAKALYDHASMQDDQSRCERVAALMGPVLRDPATTPEWRARWWLMQESALAYWGPPEAAAQAREQAERELAAGAGAACAFGLALAQLRHAQAVQDEAAVDRAMADIDRLRLLMPPGLVLRGLHAQAGVHARRGLYRAALDLEDRVLALCDDAAVPERDRGVYREQRAYALAGLQRWDEALAEFDLMRPHQMAHQARMVDVIQTVLRGAAALQREGPEAQQARLDAIRAAASVDWRRFLLAFPAWAAGLAVSAIEAGCELEFVRRAVHERRLPPPQAWREDWPWRLRVRVLGELRIERDGEPLSITGKAPKKPLDLLVLLAAQGGSVAQAAAVDELWPSLEANAPRASFEMAVSRLRKLLDVPGAVLVGDGRVSLNPDIVWIDVVAFHAWADAAEAGEPQAAAQARALLHGPPGGAHDAKGAQGLLATARERVSLRQLRLELDEADRLLAAGNAPAAVRHCERALQLDPLAEPLHRALMAAHLQAGEHAEALRAYQRCRELLRQAWGAAPSAETEDLARRALQAAEAAQAPSAGRR